MKRILFWIGFVVVLGLIIWGLAVAINKPLDDQARVGEPALVSAEDNVIGPANAPVTLIEYSDYQCPACRAYAPMIDRILDEASSSVRFVYRHYPLPQHKNAEGAAQAAEAAGNQGKFFDMSRVIFENQKVWENLAPIQAKAEFREYAQKMGLDMAAFDRDYELPSIKAKIRSQLQEGRLIGVNATPTFFVNGKAINNPTTYEEFLEIIRDAASAGVR